MLSKQTVQTSKKNIVIYILLALVTLAVYSQVHRFDFINYDDPVYITENIHVQSGLTLNGFLWAFSTKLFGLWNPLVWISFMMDYQLYGFNAGGYHITNLILHVLSTLLLFWLLNRMTGAVWKSAFVAAFFALHPLHVESVAWISERKDVLSAFFWMTTLCLYVFYTEKESAKRYLLVLFSFILALLSKPMVITLPFIMILLDYWPLKRFKSQKENPVLWQLKEKLPFLALALVVVMVTFYTPGHSASYELLPLNVRLANAPVAFMTYLAKTFWPHSLAIFYPFPVHIPLWKAAGASIAIAAVSVYVLIKAGSLPCLFVGWFWFLIAIAPAIGIVQIGDFAMADRYHYLPSIGIGIILAWCLPLLVPNEKMRQNVFFPLAIAFLSFIAFSAWKQCGYWENSSKVFGHAVRVTKDNYLAHNNLGLALFAGGRNQEAIFHYDEVIRIRPFDVVPYHNRAIVYTRLGQHQMAIENYTEAIRVKPDYAADAYLGRANLYLQLGQDQKALDDLTAAIRLDPGNHSAYFNRGNIYIKQRLYKQGIDDLNQAIHLKPDDANAYNNRAFIYLNLGMAGQALRDFSKALALKPDYADAYNNRAFVYLNTGDVISGCRDAKQACQLGNCATLQAAAGKGLCR